MRQTVHDIIAVGFDLPQFLLHACRVIPVFGRTRETDLRSDCVLAGLQVIELVLVTERAAGVFDHVILDNLRLWLYLALTAARTLDDADDHKQQKTQSDEYHHSVLFVFIP